MIPPGFHRSRSPRLALIISAITAITAISIARAGTPRSATPEVFAPGVVSGPAHDSAPTFTPDGATLYFQRSTSQGATILETHRDGTSWSAPQVASFSGAWSDLEPSLAPDGSFMVFISNRPAHVGGEAIDADYNGKRLRGHGGNLWRVDREGDGWGTPWRLPDAVNRSDSTFATNIVSDGSVYFMQPLGEGGNFRLYRSQYRRGTYQPPEPLSFSDGSSNDVDPAVAPDESFLIFGSRRAPAQDMDLFLVLRDGAGDWSEPVHLGAAVNAEGSDAEPRLGPDRCTLYFSSERTRAIHYPRERRQADADLARIAAWDNGQYNIWRVSLAPWVPACRGA
jgi:Tol biopolymer transport system component